MPRKAPWAGFAAPQGGLAVLSLEIPLLQIWASESAVSAPLVISGSDKWACPSVAAVTTFTSLFTAQTLPGYLKVLIYAWIQSIFCSCLACERFIGKDIRGMAVWREASGTTKQQGICEPGGRGDRARPLSFPSAVGEPGEGHLPSRGAPHPSSVQVSRREQGQVDPARHVCCV